MASQTAKVAISLPIEIFQAVEQVRREMKIPRSAAVAQALQAWLRERQEKEQIRRYIEGYRRHPEKISVAEAKAWMKVTAEVFHKEAPWK